MNGRPPLVLASRSPRRADILTQMGVPFVVDSADVDETPLPNETPRELVMRLATSSERSSAVRVSAVAVGPRSIAAPT